MSYKITDNVHAGTIEFSLLIDVKEHNHFPGKYLSLKCCSG